MLARKWRPKKFADLVGQHHVLQVLANALDTDRLHHAYLFAGTRGVGKTTLARILAKCLNCEAGVSAVPCEICPTCSSIDEGRFIDLVEVDAASRSKVDETRELMDNVQYAPSTGRYKIYLIDEVHMFSGHSFNALLKTLEEPPEHVKFLLATTEPKKIPVTVLSRCLQFNLKHLSVDQIHAQLQHILKQEGITSDDDSIRLIAKSADGSMRDALSLLDQAIAYGGGALAADKIRVMLGTIDSVDLYKIIEALISGQAQTLIQCTDHMAEHDPDYDLVLVELLAILQKMAVCHVLGNAGMQDEAIYALSQRVSKEELQLYYQMGIVGRKDMLYAPDPHAGFQMTLIRMLAFRPEGCEVVAKNKVAESHVNQTQLSQSAAKTELSGITHAQSAPASPHQVAEPYVNQTQLSKSAAKTELSSITQVQSAPASSYQVTEPHVNQTQLSQSVAKTELSGITQVQSAPASSNWSSIIASMPLAGLVKELAGRCILKEQSGQLLHLTIPPNAPAHLLHKDLHKQLSDMLQTHFNPEIQARVSVEESDVDSPLDEQQRMQKQKKIDASSSLKADPNVKFMQEKFGAQIDESSITLV